MDSYFDEIDSTSLLLLFLKALTKGESGTVEENSIEEEKPEEELEANKPEPELYNDEVCYIHKSSNRKRLKPRAVYF